MMVVAHAIADEERAKLAYERAFARMMTLQHRYQVARELRERNLSAWSLWVARIAFKHAARTLVIATRRRNILYRAHCRSLSRRFADVHAG